MSTRTLGLERWVPGIRAARTYRRPWLRSDLVAGVVLAAILVPQGMAYAELAGVPAVTGLYTTIGCLVGYAIFGPSRVLVLGPDSSVSPLIFAAIVPLAATDDPGTAIALAGMLALIVGLIEIGLGIGKLGFVADLLSSEVQVGYMNGLAVTIIVGQLPKLFGFSTDADGFFDEISEFFGNLDQTEVAALAVGIGVLVVLLGLPRVTTKVPAVLVAMVGALGRVGGARASPTRSRRSARSRAASRSRSSRGPSSPTSGRCSSPRWESRSCRSPTRSPRRRPSRPDAATRSTRTRR